MATLQLTTDLLAEIGGWPALKEARGLVARGRVSDVRREGAVIRARVEGAEKTHEPQITLADRVANIDVRCTCAEFRRAGRVCPHILAAGLAAMAAAGSRRPPGDGRVDVSESIKGPPSNPSPPLFSPPREISTSSAPPLGTAAATTAPSPGTNMGRSRLPRRVLAEDELPGTDAVEITVLLPMQLNEALAKDPVRVILEARREGEAQSQPFDAVTGKLAGGFAVREEDERLLAALESLAGGASGINAVPRGKIGAFLHALGGHPRVGLGKKQRVEVWASEERARIVLSRGEDGALVLSLGNHISGSGGAVAAAVPSGGAVGGSISHGGLTRGAAKEGGIVRGPSTAPKQVRLAQDDGIFKVADATPAPPPGTGTPDAAATLPIPNWSFDGVALTETPALPPGFSSGTRIVPLAQIPDFLSRELPALERSCDLEFAPGFEEFRLEIGQPTFEARLEGALSGLTLELVARYGTWRDDLPVVPGPAGAGPSTGKASSEQTFSLDGRTESNAYQRYFPASVRDGLRDGLRVVADAAGTGPSSATDPNPVNLVNPVQNFPSVFWRRNVLAEREALAEIVAAGFAHVRSAATVYSLVGENNVARFLANTLPRWRRLWSVTYGPRLESTMEQIDVAEPEFSLRGESRAGSGEDWLSLDLKLSVGGAPIALDQAEVQRWLQTGQSHARQANKRVLLVPTEAWSEMREVLADCAVEQEPGKLRIERTFAPFLSGALAAQGFRESGASSVRALTSAATAEVKAILGEKLWAQLRPYQAQGVEWLASLAQQNLHGLLADDMGLGKTLQALAFAAWVKAKNVELRTKSAERSDVSRSKLASPPPSSLPSNLFSPLCETSPSAPSARSKFSDLRSTLPCMVVCPTSLVVNWLREAARFVPHLRALDLTGADRAGKFAAIGEYDLLVTSYAILRRDIEQYRNVDFSLVILDEAQHIKNRASQNAVSAKALRARHRLILTGTPLENSMLDLWSLFDFLLPKYLGTAAEFKERYEAPLTKSPEPKLMERLRHKVRPFFLRRTKEEVLTELPPKMEFPTLCELSDEQREVYRAVLAQGRREVFEHSDKAGRASGKDRLAVLTTLLRLRQVCCHLGLLPGSAAVAAAVPSGGAAGGTTSRLSAAGREPAPPKEKTPSPQDRRLPIGRWKEPSAKMERTFELIDEAVDGGHRVLLFSQFVKVLHLLRAEAVRREMRFCYLDGQTVERQAEVDRFQADAGIPLFFISLKAGGTGLNLTGADTVIHFDPWWNPAVEEQATSRAHRMGQARRVSAYKLIAAGTVEEKIQALQARKRELFEASLGGDAAFVEKLSGEDMEELLAE